MTVAHQAPLSMEFCRLKYWSGLPFPSPGDLSDPGIEPESLALVVGFFTTESPRKPEYYPIKEQIYQNKDVGRRKFVVTKLVMSIESFKGSRDLSTCESNLTNSM